MAICQKHKAKWKKIISKGSLTKNSEKKEEVYGGGTNSWLPNFSYGGVVWLQLVRQRVWGMRKLLCILIVLVITWIYTCVF